MNQDLGKNTVAICTQAFQAREEKLDWTPHTSNCSSLWQLSAFCQMNEEEQREFLARRFLLIDGQELVTIVKAIYGNPVDKGRPRRK